MRTTEAKRLLGVAEPLTRENIAAAFRRAAKRTHPDVSSGEWDHRIVEAKDTLLAALDGEPCIACGGTGHVPANKFSLKFCDQCKGEGRV